MPRTGIAQPDFQAIVEEGEEVGCRVTQRFEFTYITNCAVLKTREMKASLYVDPSQIFIDVGLSPQVNRMICGQIVVSWIRLFDDEVSILKPHVIMEMR